MRGLHYIHQRYGQLEWSRLLEPAIRLARDGFEVSRDFATAMDLSTQSFDFLTHDPAWAEDFVPQGRRLQHGDIMTRTRYARMLESVSRLGAAAFYDGLIAEATVEAVRNKNGTMELSDLRDYDIVSRPPVKISYNGFNIYSTGAPSSGAVILSILKIMEGYNQSTEESCHLKTHRMDEAMRFGYGKVL